MLVEDAYIDVPVSTSLIIEPILLQRREIVTELMKSHREGLDANEVFFMLFADGVVAIRFEKDYQVWAGDY